MKLLIPILFLASCAEVELPQNETYEITSDLITWTYVYQGEEDEETIEYTDHGTFTLYPNGGGQVTWPGDSDELWWVKDGQLLTITFYKSYQNDIEMTNFGKIEMVINLDTMTGTGYDEIVMGENLTITYEREMTIKFADS